MKYNWNSVLNEVRCIIDKITSVEVSIRVLLIVPPFPSSSFCPHQSPRWFLIDSNRSSTHLKRPIVLNGLPTYLPTNLPINLPTNLPTNQPIYLLSNLPTNITIYLPTFLGNCKSTTGCIVHERKTKFALFYKRGCFSEVQTWPIGHVLMNLNSTTSTLNICLIATYLPIYFTIIFKTMVLSRH